jgi:hypothetical protein
MPVMSLLFLKTIFDIKTAPQPGVIFLLVNSLGFSLGCSSSEWIEYPLMPSLYNTAKYLLLFSLLLFATTLSNPPPVRRPLIWTCRFTEPVAAHMHPSSLKSPHTMSKFGESGVPKSSKLSTTDRAHMTALIQALDEMSNFGIRDSSKSPSASDKARMKPIVQAYKEIEGKERPSKYTHRAAWNDHFERSLALRYTCYSYTLRPIETWEECEWSWSTNTITDLNLGIAQRTKELMRDEGLLVAVAVENLVYGNFESEWKELDLERKRELVLEGLYRGSCCSPRENSREICPELTIEGLVGDGEYNLINLVGIFYYSDYACP